VEWSIWQGLGKPTAEMIEQHVRIQDVAHGHSDRTLFWNSSGSTDKFSRPANSDKLLESASGAVMFPKRCVTKTSCSSGLRASACDSA
jgi:hypothetical protein